MRGVHPEIADTVRQMVQATARRWPGASRDDLEGAAWVIALEAMRRYCATDGRIGAFLGRTLKRALANEARRQICPVHLPRNREYQHRTSDYVAVGDADLEFRPSAADCLDDVLHEVILARQIRDAVIHETRDTVTRSLALSCGDARLWSLVEPDRRSALRCEVKKVYHVIARRFARSQARP